MRKNPWVERVKNVLIALLAVILLALTVLALPVKTVTDTPWAGGACASVCLADGHFAGRSDRYADGGRRKRHGRGPAGFRFRTEPRRADELSVFVLHTGRVV